MIQQAETPEIEDLEMRPASVHEPDALKGMFQNDLQIRMM